MDAYGVAPMASHGVVSLLEDSAPAAPPSLRKRPRLSSEWSGRATAAAGSPLTDQYRAGHKKGFSTGYETAYDLAYAAGHMDGTMKDRA
eukprot:7689994-Pyramimonas_sp.AAC.1